MIGFFDKAEFGEAEKKGGKAPPPPAPKRTAPKVFTCTDCGRLKKCRNRISTIYGKGNRGILVVTEFPTAEEDRTGEPGKGKPLDTLRKTLEKAGVDLERDCWKLDALQCRPSYFGSVKDLEIQACSRFIRQAIEELKPSKILLLGSAGFKGLIAPRLKGRAQAPFESFVGELIPEQELKARVGITYGTEYMEREAESDRVWRKEWEKHILALLKAPPVVPHDYLADCEITLDKAQAIQWIKEARKKAEIMAFDYETTGIKPHAPGHEIVCASFCYGGKAYGFPMFPDEDFQRAWRRLLQSPAVGKIAHHLKYEHQWTAEKLGYEVKGWDWDTMTMAHVLRNKQAVGLKPQAYMKLGVVGYDDGIGPWMKSPGKGANGLNRMKEAMKQFPEKVLQYCAMDSLVSFRLYEWQKAAATEDDLKGHDLLREADIALSQIQQNGMRIDVPKMLQTKRELAERLDKMKAELAQNPWVVSWEKKRGRPFKYTSTKDFPDYLFKFRGYTPTKETATGNASTDAESLRALQEENNDPVIGLVLGIKRWEKALSTYIAQFERELVDDKIRPIFKLHSVATFRSSAADPNFQNIPKRDEEVKKTIRSFIVPRPGNRLKEYDYGAMEVAAGCFYHKDRVMIKYVTHGEDMHKDSAADLFLKKPEEVNKKTERGLVKNAFVFPEFYGSYWKQVAPDLWDRMTTESREWLASHGIKSFSKFKDHVKSTEDKLWKRFSQFKKWMKDSEKEYERKGFLTMHTGFTVRWPMKKNEIINYRTQGTAFHCLLYALTNIQLNHAHEFKHSWIIGQIHDALVVDVHPDEEARMDYLVWWYGTQKIREDWPWINVPLKIEAEASAVDGSWAEMGEEVVLDFSKEE